MYQYRYTQYIYGYESSSGQYVVIECHDPKPHAPGKGNRHQCSCRQLLSGHGYQGFERCPECYGKRSEDSRDIEKVYENTGSLVKRKEHKRKEVKNTFPKLAPVDRSIEDEWEDASSHQTSYTDLHQREEISSPTYASTKNKPNILVFGGCNESSGGGRLSPDLIFELELNYPDSESRAYISEGKYTDEFVCSSQKCVLKPSPYILVDYSRRRYRLPAPILGPEGAIRQNARHSRV